jgi:putative transposase
MGISRSTYYAVGQGNALKRESEAALRSAIENVVVEWPAYGYRRVTHELRRRGIVVNHKRIARIMREEALIPRRVRRFLATTDSDHAEPIYPNLALGFRPSGPNQLWVADITYSTPSQRSPPGWGPSCWSMFGMHASTKLMLQ